MGMYEPNLPVLCLISMLQESTDLDAASTSCFHLGWSKPGYATETDRSLIVETPMDLSEEPAA